ncbi:nucleoid-structuring protein H-NS, partial [Helicobacter sp. MIT 11-5569]
MHFSFLYTFTSIAFASDPITMDSLFKKQIGLRSITSISYLSSGNAYIYNMYPTLVAQPDT